MSRRNSKSNGFPIYRTYKFHGQDPDVAEVLRITADDKQSAESSKVSRSTIRNWRSHKTRRPQHATLQAVAIANGKRFRLTDD